MTGTGRPKSPSAEQVQAVVGFLRTIGDRWETRQGIRLALGITDREIRLCAAAAHGAVIHGQSGFKWAGWATQAERLACYESLMKQAETEQRRAQEILAWKKEGEPNAAQA